MKNQYWPNAIVKTFEDSQPHLIATYESFDSESQAWKQINEFWGTQFIVLCAWVTEGKHIVSFENHLNSVGDVVPFSVRFS